MAGFFSLGNDSTNRRNINSSNNNNISYRNEQQIISYQEIDNKNSELWHLHSSGGGLLAPTEDGDEITRSNKSNSNSNSNSNRYNLIRMSMGSSGSGNTINCQDCGNQAKKDCVYMRCRTCCKSRGFDCVTHVKSTWVPASVRRERHQNLIIQDQHQPQQHQQQQEQEHYYMGVVNPKRRRDNNSSSSSLVCTQLPITTSTTSVTNTNTASFSGMELRNFPAEVSSEAVFRCVRVSSVDETDEEYAYQTAVNIGGHVFKGILYDHGPDHPHQSSAPSPSYVAGETGGNLAVRPTASIGGPTAAASIMPTSSSSPAVGYLDPSFYPLTYMSPGTPFFSNPNQRP